MPLHLLNQILMDPHHLVDFQPRGLVRPQLRRSRLVGRILIDFIFKDVDVVSGYAEEFLPDDRKAMEDIVEDHVRALSGQATVVQDIILSKIEGQATPAILKVLTRLNETILHEHRSGRLEDYDCIGVVEEV